MIMALGSGLRGCPRRMRWKSSPDGNVPKVWEAGNTDLIGLFQICSSTAFGLASPPVSLKPSRPRPLPEARNESTAISESLHGIVSKVSAPEVSEWSSA